MKDLDSRLRCLNGIQFILNMLFLIFFLAIVAFMSFAFGTGLAAAVATSLGYDFKW